MEKVNGGSGARMMRGNKPAMQDAISCLFLFLWYFFVNVVSILTFLGGCICLKSLFVSIKKDAITNNKINSQKASLKSKYFD